MLLKNAKLYGQEGTWDISIQEEKIDSIKPAANSAESSDEQVIDLKGKIVLLPYAEPHIHLDYVLTAGTPYRKSARPRHREWRQNAGHRRRLWR